jgi:hypothetical protein
VPDAALSIFSDLWSDVETVADDVYHGIEQLAVTITNAINVAITAAGQILNAIVHSVEEAIDAISSFFNQLLIDIESLVNYLELLFDFDAILKAHAVISLALQNIPVFLTQQIGDGSGVSTAITSALSSLTGISSVDGTNASNPAATQSSQASQSNTSVSGANSVGGKSMYSKMKDNQGGMTITGSVAGTAVSDAVSAEKGIADFITSLVDLIMKLPTMNSSDAANALLAVVQQLEQDVDYVLEGLAGAAGTMVALIADAVTLLMDTLAATIDIPFISALYKWLTNRDLSLLDLFCLVLGVLVHITYTLVTGRIFWSDAATQLPPVFTQATKTLVQVRPHTMAAALRRPALPPAVTAATGTGPQITITSPSTTIDSSSATTVTLAGTVSSTTYMVHCSASDSAPIDCSFENGQFTGVVPLTSATTSVTATATDSSGNTGTATLGVYDYGNPLTWGTPDSAVPEVLFIVFRTLELGCRAGADFIFASSMPSPYLPNPARGFLQLIQGVANIGASSLQFAVSMPAMVGEMLYTFQQNDLKPVFDEAAFGVGSYYQYKTISSFAGDLVSSALIMNKGQDEIFGGAPLLGDGFAGALTAINPNWSVTKPDQLNYYAGFMMSLSLVALAIVDGWEASKAPEFTSNVPSDTRTMAWLIFARDQCYRAVSLPAFLYSNYGAQQLNYSTLTYELIMGLRALAGTAAIVCHGFAAFKYILPNVADTK